MTMNTAPMPNEEIGVAHQPQAASGLAIVRVTIGAMLVWVFFENLGKGLYTPAGYAGLISVGQQAYVGLGAYILFAFAILAGLSPLWAIPLAGIIAGRCPSPAWC